jgi:high-affinity Fe2+/Pb2+ permease
VPHQRISPHASVEIGPFYSPEVVSTGQFLVAFVVAGAAGTLVFFHADRNRIRYPSVWAGFVFLFLVLGLPAYAIHVRRVRSRRGR